MFVSYNVCRAFCTSPPLHDDGEGLAPTEISQFLCWFGNLQKGTVTSSVTNNSRSVMLL